LILHLALIRIMILKYLLSGRAVADLKHLRNVIDLWPSEFQPPSVINSLSQVQDSDTIITTGYLGMSYSLIKKHSASKVFIIDNGLFSSHGVPLFRLLDGRLDTLFNSTDNASILPVIEKQAIVMATRFQANSISSHDSLELPWSIPIKRICKVKLSEYLLEYNSLLASEKRSSRIIGKEYAMALIDPISNSPILRKIRFYKRDSIYILPTFKSIIAPNSTLAFWAYWFNKKVLVSRVNPFYAYSKKQSHDSRDNLLIYLSRISFQMRDIAQYVYNQNE